jgi:signal transduction histidine kinase
MQDLSMQFSEIIVNSLNADSSLITILIEDSEIKDKIIFKVIDNGRGMTKEFLEKLTDPFQSTRKVRKIGLGTAFFKEMCDQCEGEFKVESVVGEGSTVSTYVRKNNIDVPPMGDIP